MKLVTEGDHICYDYADGILIHTSVKLVTQVGVYGIYQTGILIHTSVKLVT